MTSERFELLNSQAHIKILTPSNKCRLKNIAEDEKEKEVHEDEDGREKRNKY